MAQAGLTHVANAKLPPGMFEELYDEDALRDPPDFPSNPSFGDQATHRKLCDDIQRRKLHNERVIKQSESWFKTKNNEFFVIITDSMAKTHPGLRDLLRDRCKLEGDDIGYYDGVAAMTFIDRWVKKMHLIEPHHDFYQKQLDTILKMQLRSLLHVGRVLLVDAGIVLDPGPNRHDPEPWLSKCRTVSNGVERRVDFEPVKAG